MFESSNKPNEVRIEINEHLCFFCKGKIQGSPQTWRQLYKNEKLVGYAHKKCLEGKRFD